MDPVNSDNILIVLVGTTHPGNIGAVARAMKTMGLRRLSLVNPKRFPCAQASARAAGADDVLYEARVFDSMPAALADCHWVVGTSARVRSIQWPEFEPRECAERIVTAARDRQVALVFGREHSGLTNEELDRCHGVVRIPTDPGYRSLNLASAVQVLSYEIRMAWLTRSGASTSSNGQQQPIDSCYDEDRGNAWWAAPGMESGVEENPNAVPDKAGAHRTSRVSASEWEGFFQHLESSLQDIGYYDPARPKKLMRRLRRLFHRAGLERSELNILRGILSAAQNAARK
ncbi:MAG: tRNA (cytidine32/uridine32-2'-O)-methyltransferase [Candidatus Kentron sp. G]|nr:MAG: tRNA (cytidine32/uridine32-2'-O)-methyltransferase [Candidatus Kentron sp. G]VFM97123.1 MAG: tRNA (cytidine32/uridine32-2'-O)-methyltransferase [Candidatus Kentron sp. G]VFN00770.1 MAG: tRNA (cytidine32/uridine32-2'-O)-methyltransferase [Candidatus Kentron sp. G]